MNVVWWSHPVRPSVTDMRRSLLGGALLVSALLLTGCSAAGGANESIAVDGAPQAPQVGVDVDAAAEDAAGGADGAESSTADRSVIVTGYMTVTADDPIAASREAARIVEAAGGRIDSRSESAPSSYDAGSATLTLRIPADRLDAVLDQLAELGRADEISTSSYDVTLEVRDLEARISALSATIERLTDLLAQASDIEDLIRLETEIGNRQAELESLQAQQRDVADQVAMSTISLYLRSEAQAPATEPGDFWSGLQAGWSAFVGFFAGLLVALGVLLPWIVFAGLVTAVVILLVKWRRRVRAAGGDPAA